jgi:hypothetical protein
MKAEEERAFQVQLTRLMSGSADALEQSTQQSRRLWTALERLLARLGMLIQFPSLCVCPRCIHA